VGTVREELHALVERVASQNEQRALETLRHIVDCPPPERDENNSVDLAELLRRHFREVCQRLGLNADQLPQNGYCSGGVSGDRVELTKDWESEDARHRLSKIDVQGHDIIVLERMKAVGDAELRYEVRVFTDKSEGRAEVHIPIEQSSSHKG
jgi:hypothetical protein